ncbi:MAG: DNA repair protein RecO [Planctomycetes bacterium]|nr:DNA repair protein RecO [Planctomycetota bacterium]
MAIEKATGITVRLADYSETSQIATFVTDVAGRLSAIAKGARRTNSATGGPLDLLTVNEIVFSTSRSGGLATLREARTMEQFPALGRCVPRYYAALYCAEVSAFYSEGSEGSSGHFDLLRDSLRALSNVQEESLTNILFYFESHVLAVSGLSPNLATCARCGRGVPTRGPARISLEDGGLLCDACSGGVEIRRGSLAALRRIFESTPQNVQRLKLGRDLHRDVSGFLAAAVAHGAGRVPRLLRYVRPDAGNIRQRWMGAPVNR